MPPTNNPRSPRAPRPAPAFNLPAAPVGVAVVPEAVPVVAAVPEAAVPVAVVPVAVVPEAAVPDAEVLEAAVDADEAELTADDELPEFWSETTPPPTSDWELDDVSNELVL